MAFQSVGGEEGGEKRVHQIFQRLGSRDIDFRKRERRAVEFLVARMKFVPVTPLPLGFSLYGLLSCLPSLSLPPILFLIPPNRRERDSARSQAPRNFAPLLSRPASYCLDETRIKRNKRFPPRSSSSSSSACTAFAVARRDEETSSEVAGKSLISFAPSPHFNPANEDLSTDISMRGDTIFMKVTAVEDLVCVARPYRDRFYPRGVSAPEEKRILSSLPKARWSLIVA